MEAGIGYSVLPDYLCRHATQERELVQIGYAGPKNNIYLVWEKGALKYPGIAFAKDVISAFSNIKYAAN